MPQINGIEICRRLRKEFGYRGLIIFVTAFDSHMKNAFDVNPFRFLLKQTDEKLFFTQLQHILLDAKDWIHKDEEVLYFGEKNKRRINIKDIRYIRVTDHCISVHCVGGKNPYTFTEELKVVEQRIKEKKIESLIRVNRSAIVNLAYCDYRTTNEIFIGEERFRIGSTYKEQVMKLFAEYIMKEKGFKK